MVDALAFLESVSKGPAKMPMKPLILLQLKQPSYKYLKMVEVKADNKLWFYDIQKYLIKRVYPKYATEKDKTVIRRLTSKFISHQGVLYRRTSDGMQLRCLNKTEATKAMKEIHDGVYGPHINRVILAKKLMK